MGKYDPLTAYLSRHASSEVELTFREIERLVRGILPKAAMSADWWDVDTDPADAPQKRAITAAGFRPDVSLKGERVRFRSRDSGAAT